MSINIPESAAINGCWATLMTSEHLLPGLVAFANSLLRIHGSKYPLVIMATSKLSSRAINVINSIKGCLVRPVDSIHPKLSGKDLAYPRFGEVWSKLQAWGLEEYERVVLVDSDMLIRSNMDELMEDPIVFMERQEEDQDWIASSYACTCNPNKIKIYPEDWIPKNCGFTPQSHPESLTSPPQPTSDSVRTHRLINSGLVVLKPSSDVLRRMIHTIDNDPRVSEYRFPDQDFLADWYQGRLKILPWCYNALKKLRVVHENIWRDDQVRNVHYILDKPWTLGRPGGRSNPNDSDHMTHGWWWADFDALRKKESHYSSDKSFRIEERDWLECVEKYVNLG